MNEKQMLDQEVVLTVNEKSDLETVLKSIEDLKPGAIREIILPESVNFDSFLITIGNAKRSYEYGGDWDPKTRKIRIARSTTQFNHGFASGEAVPNVGYPQRRDDQGIIVGDMWHTHPWETQEKTYQKRYGDDYRPELNCCPSGQDLNVVFTFSLCEQVDGKHKVFSSPISASGFIGETIASGLNLNLDRLRELDCDEQSINELLQFLTYDSPQKMNAYIKEDKRAEVIPLIEEYYKKKFLHDGSFYAGIDEFVEQMRGFLTKDRFRRMTTGADKMMRDSMNTDLPDYPSRRVLERMGFDSVEKQNAVLEMLGVKTSIYQFDDDGNRAYVLSDIFSCDIETEVRGLNKANNASSL